MRGFGDLESVIMHMVCDHDGPVAVRDLSTSYATTLAGYALHLG